MASQSSDRNPQEQTSLITTEQTSLITTEQTSLITTPNEVAERQFFSVVYVSLSVQESLHAGPYPLPQPQPPRTCSVQSCSTWTSKYRDPPRPEHVHIC